MPGFSDIPQDKIDEYKEAFAMFDKNNDKSITAEELGTVMRSLGQNPTEKDLKEMIDQADTENKNGKIEFEEFAVMMYSKCSEDPKETLRDAFKLFDKNGDGCIVMKELKLALTNLGEKLTDEEVKEMIDAADVDKDGKVNYEEFVKMMTKK